MRNIIPFVHRSGEVFYSVGGIAVKSLADAQAGLDDTLQPSDEISAIANNVPMSACIPVASTPTQPFNGKGTLDRFTWEE